MQEKQDKHLGRGVWDYLTARGYEIFEYARPNIFFVGLLGVFGFPGYWLIWEYVFPQDYENLGLRLLCALVALPWLFYPSMQERWKSWFPWYFFASTFLVMPFFFTYMMVRSDFSNVWVTSTLSGLFLLILLIYSWQLVLLMMVGGVLLSILLTWVQGFEVQYAMFPLEYIPVFLFAIIGGAVCNNLQRRQQEETVRLNKILDQEVQSRTRDLEVKVDELDRARQTIELANRSKSQFLAVMSHELRNPMNGILGITQLLKRDQLTQQQDAYVDMLRESSDILNALLDNILNFSRLEVEGRTIRCEDVEPESMVRNLCGLMRSRAVDKGLAVHFEVADDIPAMLNGDVICFRQVLLNLLGNAIKFTEQGEIRVKLELIKREAGKVELEMVVEDTGIGIAPEQESLVFMPFRQIEETIGKRQEGAGLGLSICQKMLEDTGGSIGFSSDPGKGSRFWFRQCFEVVEPQSEPGLPLDASAPPLQVLVVEDNDIGRLAVVRLLEHGNYQCTQASDGVEALECLKQACFDLVLMDINMPKLDGLDTTRRIRALADPVKASVPVVAVTGNMEERIETCLEAGMNDVLLKPLKVSALESVIAKYARACLEH